MRIYPTRVDVTTTDRAGQWNDLRSAVVSSLWLASDRIDEIVEVRNEKMKQFEDRKSACRFRLTFVGRVASKTKIGPTFNP